MATIQPVISSVRQKIQDLYKFRDEYFIVSPEDKFVHKDNIINTKVDDILNELNQFSDCSEDKGTCYFLKGWLLNIKSSYDKEAFDLLAKSVKLSPNNNIAWIELGECYFKKGELKSALNCFQKVIDQDSSNKRALRNASIILRSLRCNGEERKTNILKSIDLAKKAVEKDFNDGESWSILGNSYLTLFFISSGTNKSSLFKNCKSAYQKALLDAKVETKSDVLFNYSSILQYNEEFEQALECLSKACKYDPSWKELQERKMQLEFIFNDIFHKSTNNSLVKARKLNNIRTYLKNEEDKIRSVYANDERMFNGNVVQISQLTEGSNQCLLVCKVVSYTTDTNNVFYCSVIYAIDSTGQCIPLFIYDLLQNKGPNLGDTVLVVRPVFKTHRINVNNKPQQFGVIKIINPLLDIYVNNKRLSLDCISTPIVNVTLKSD